MNDFRHLGDRVVHRGHVWHVAVAEFEAPDGERFQRDVVRSPGAVAAVALIEGGPRREPAVALVRQYRPAPGQWVIELPAGMRDVPGEPPERTIERELVEEAGLRPGRLEPLAQVYPSAGMTDSVVAVYLATELSRVPRDVHGPEERHMEVLEVPLSEAVGMVLDGRIRDSKAVVGLLLVERRLRQAATP